MPEKVMPDLLDSRDPREFKAQLVRKARPGRLDPPVRRDRPERRDFKVTKAKPGRRVPLDRRGRLDLRGLLEYPATRVCWVVPSPCLWVPRGSDLLPAQQERIPLAAG